MTMLEAIQALEDQPEKWIRPKSYKGWRKAFYVCNGKMMFVPTPKGAVAFMTPDTTVYHEEWEVVEPHLVNDGK